MFSNKGIILLFTILLLSAALRFYKLGLVPISPDWDEAAIGFNAYSILHTGRDEYGKLLPFVFKSFNDYKPPLYIYLTVPIVAIFGLNTWSVRVVSAFFGVLAVAGTYFLTKALLDMCFSSETKFGTFTKKPEMLNLNQNFRSLGLSFLPHTAALLLAISPWHLFFSRVAFEANLAVTLNIWGTFLFIQALRMPKLFYVSSILFVLGMYAYHTERIFVPLYLALLVYVYIIRKIQISKEIIFAFISALLLSIPIVVTVLNNEASKRLESTTIFRKQTEYLRESVLKYNWDSQLNSRLGKLVNDRRFEWGKIIINGYLAHFSPKWLFSTGDQPRHHAPDSGLLYLFTAPFIILGLISLFGFFKNLKTYILGWLAISPIAAALTFEVPHAVRTIVFIPIYEIVTALGLWTAYLGFRNFVKVITLSKKIIIYVLLLFAVFASGFEIIRYFDLYYKHMNIEYSSYWQFGYDEAVSYAMAIEQKYERIVVNTDLEQPYIFFLFYMQFSPGRYLKEGGTASGRIGKYEFRNIDWSSEVIDGNTLYIDTIKNSPYPNLKKISALNGNPVIALLDSR